jgi:drug/metabolite transporter (DMT)-like permease
LGESSWAPSRISPNVHRMTADRRNALAALAAAGLIWGLTVPMSKVAMGWLDPLWLTAARFAAAGPVLALAARGSLRRALTWRVAGWGVLFYAGVVGIQNVGVAMTSVSHGALICGSVPAFVALVALAGGRGSAGPVAWTGFGIAALGVVLVAGTGGGASPLGDGLVLLAAFLSAFYVVAQPSVLDGRDPAAVTAVQMTAGALAVAPFAIVFDGLPPVGAVPTLHELSAFAALAGLGSLVPFVLYAYGQKRVAPEVAGAFVNLEPLVGATIGAFAFGDPFGTPQLVGATAIVGGILMSVDWPSRRYTDRYDSIASISSSTASS